MAIHYQGDLSMCGLPKWPAFVVVGKPVTPKQAAEIILRTDHGFPDISGNDKHYARMVVELFGAPPRPKYSPPESTTEEMEENHRQHMRWYRCVDDLRERLNHIPLHYLQTDRIMSCYVGGVNGWVNWDGTIGENNRNIGKWPEIDEVATDWQALADAFPYLDLQCQLFNGEQNEDYSRPVVHFIVRNGDVTVRPSNGVVLQAPTQLTTYAIARTMMRGGDDKTFTISDLKSKVVEVYGENYPKWRDISDD